MMLSAKKVPKYEWGKKNLYKKANDTKVSIPGVERPWLSKAEGFILPNHDTGRILPSESQVITNLNCNIKKKKWLVMSLGKQNLDNLFGPMYDEYYPTSSNEVSNNSAANTLDNDHTSSSSSIVVDQDDAPPIVSSSEE
ncbi:hypothetical protein Tco_0392668 [Tanacetum coccineum]